MIKINLKTMKLATEIHPRNINVKKGQSGNPNGRPKKTASSSDKLSNQILKELDELVTITENGRSLTLSKRKLLIKALTQDAIKGKPFALKKVLVVLENESAPTDFEITPEELKFLDQYLKECSTPDNQKNKNHG